MWTDLVPKETLSPLAPVISEHGVTAGFGYRIKDHWSFDIAGLYAFKYKATYTNPSFPFGPNAVESVRGYFLYSTLSYRY